MKTSTIGAMVSLTVSLGASASGTMPLFELDFSRSATETLKRLGIHDACIIQASTPVAFTFCREGSSTLYKYQDLDLAQLAAIKSDQMSPSTASLKISVVELNSPACLLEDSASAAKPSMARWLVLGLLALSVLLGLRYSYRLILARRSDPNGFSDSSLPPLDETLPRFNSSRKAVAAFGIAVAAAFVYFGFLGL